MPKRHYRSALALLAFCASWAASAQTITELNIGDVYFQYRPAQGASRLCGFAIQGNHNSRKEPRVEWDLNIDMLVYGSERTAGVSAGTFEVQNKRRQPRQPITAIDFVIDGEGPPIPVRLVGAPNVDNAVRGVIDYERSGALFTAFSNDRHIAITLTYADGTNDILKTHGFRDLRKFGGGKNSYLNECLRGMTPPIGHLRQLP